MTVLADRSTTPAPARETLGAGPGPADTSGLRVLHVIGGGDTGGAMAHVLPLLSTLRAQGCDANLVCLGGGGLAAAAADRGLPLTVLPMSSPWDARVLPGLARALGGGWDVVHTHGMRANIPVRLLGRAAVGGRPCLFTTVHSDLALDYSDPRQAGLYSRLDVITRREVDVIVCVSEDLRRRLVAQGAEPGRLLVVHSGLELNGGSPPTSAYCRPGAFEADGSGGAAADAVPTFRLWEGGLPALGAPRLGTVARLVPVKDLELFLEVVHRLLPAFPRLRAAIVGEGPEREPLEATVRRLGLEEVVSLPGELRPASALMREFDVYLVTSRSEGIPIAVLEAMVAGLPVVATEVGGLPEAIVSGTTGLLVPREGTPEALAGALATAVAGLLAEPARRAAMGGAAAQRVRESFTAEAMAHVVHAAYRRCVEGRRGDARRAQARRGQGPGTAWEDEHDRR